MDLLIVAATIGEIQASLTNLKAVAQTNKPIYHVSTDQHNIDFLITGAGILQTAFYLGQQLSQKRYELALNVGIAGTYRSEFPPGHIIHIISEQIADWGAENENDFIPIHQLDFF